MQWVQSLLWLLLFATLGPAQSTDGLYNLVKRRMPNHADHFHFTIDTSNLTGTEGYDQFEVSNAPDGKILIKGNTISALSSGYFVYDSSSLWLSSRLRNR